MSYVAAWTGLAVVVIIFQLVLHRLARRKGLPDEADQLRQLRNLAESFNGVFLLGSFALVALVGGVALVLRGDDVGYAWFVPVVLFCLSAAESERHRRWLKNELGDRGRVELGDRALRRKKVAQGFLVFGAAGWLSSRLLEAALGPEEPHWAVILTGLFGLALIVGFVGWLATKTLSYAQGDDLEEPRA